jgi:dihydroneopterin aldolase / 2-amino-4-hydroxy-6-hydroxymethyldihydropteridine diphosphokinase
VRTIHWGPRTIDLDIIFYDNEIVETSTLTIPHPEMKNREFVLEPLSEIASRVIHPILLKSVHELYQDIKN